MPTIIIIYPDDATPEENALLKQSYDAGRVNLLGAQYVVNKIIEQRFTDTFKPATHTIELHLTRMRPALSTANSHLSPGGQL